MRAKYILRGLGLGVIITAVLMSAYTRNAVADARVNVLKEYGLGEEAVLAETLINIDGEDKDEIQDNANAASPEVVPFDVEPAEPEIVSNEEVDLQNNTVPDGTDVEIVIQGDIVDDENAAETSQSVVVSVPSNENAADVSDDTVTIVISKGDDSGTVARKLHSAGLVENAAEFDAFLMQHGYDKKLNTGTKLINMDDSWQEMAEKLTR